MSEITFELQRARLKQAIPPMMAGEARCQLGIFVLWVRWLFKINSYDFLELLGHSTNVFLYEPREATPALKRAVLSLILFLRENLAEPDGLVEDLIELGGLSPDEDRNRWKDVAESLRVVALENLK